MEQGLEKSLLPRNLRMVALGNRANFEFRAFQVRGRMLRLWMCKQAAEHHDILGRSTDANAARTTGLVMLWVQVLEAALDHILPCRPMPCSRNSMIGGSHWWKAVC